MTATSWILKNAAELLKKCNQLSRAADSWLYYKLGQGGEVIMKTFLLITVLLLLVSCAAGPQINRYKSLKIEFLHTYQDTTFKHSRAYTQDGYLYVKTRDSQTYIYKLDAIKKMHEDFCGFL